MARRAVARRRGRSVGSEILAIYPHRWEAPRDAWHKLFSAAEQEIAILVYAGLFLAEDAGVQKILADKARAGVRIRVLLGDPDSPQVAERGADEGIDEAVAAKIRNVLILYRPLRDIAGHRVPAAQDDLVQLDLPRR